MKRTVMQVVVSVDETPHMTPLHAIRLLNELVGVEARVMDTRVVDLDKGRRQVNRENRRGVN